jgi:two-component system phosphate regulon sensor histidine kinase PhoR
MWINSRAVAALIAISVAGLTTAFTSLVTGTPVVSLIVTGIISFAASFLLIYITFEFLIFKEINEIHHKLLKIKKKDFSFQTASNDDENFSMHPIKRMNAALMSYAKQKQSEIEELVRAEKYRRDFIADISHELKTPIFAAQGFISTLIDGAVDDDEVRDKFLRKAEKSLDSLSHLVRDLILLSKIESGDIQMKIGEFDILRLASEVLDECEFAAAEKNVRMRIKTLKMQGIMVSGDYQRIKQVLINLVQNAIKYGHENGFVVIGITEKNNFVKISVKDNGPGIPPEHLNRIFERFYRIEKSRSKAEGGSGLGLAIVKHILKKHNSDIKVKSWLGKGTNFSFKLLKINEEKNNSLGSAEKKAGIAEGIKETEKNL